MEKNTDAFLESNEKSKKKQEEVEETVNNRKFPTDRQTGINFLS